MHHRLLSRSAAPRALAAAWALLLASPAATAAPACPATSTPTAWSGTLLDSGTTRDGVVYDADGGAKLQLAPAAGIFRSTSLGIADQTVYAAVADFDKDGWDDFAGAGEELGFLRVYRNYTMLNPEPDWTQANAVRTPRFQAVVELASATVNNRRRPMAAGDFDGNGWPDIFRASAAAGDPPSAATLWLNSGVDASGNPVFGAGYDAMATGTTASNLGTQTWSGTSIQAVDMNGDRKLDLIVGGGQNNGEIRVFLNTCTLVTPLPVVNDVTAMLPCLTPPKFRWASTLVTNLGFPAAASLPVFAFEDVDGDGLRDLIASAASCCATAANRLRLWRGVSGGGLAPTPQSIAFQGGATVVFARDFSGDGKPDLIVGTDNWNYNPDHGADLFYWINSGTATPFANAPTKLTSYSYPTLYDYDVGFVFDYDHDPRRTLDLMVADGNHTSNFYVQANRVIDQYVPCGDVASGVIDLGALETSEMVVTAARLSPTADPPPTSSDTTRGTLRYFLSNEEPANWVEATPCADDPGDRCASFPRPVGRRVRWKATMCSNDARTRTPKLYTIEATFDYTRAREHFRAGAVVHDGVAYVGGFRQPGDRGHLFAVAAGFSETYWDAATAIDAAGDGARKVWTSDRASTALVPFAASHAGNATLQATLGVSDATQATSLIAWVRSKRFGVGNEGIERSRLGAIETSTPAVLTPPGLPTWYVFSSSAARQAHAAFRTAQQARPTLLLFGAKDGMIHAIRSTPTAIRTAPSGQEAWAFIPPKIASGMLADYTNSLTGGETRIASYPDGSPTLADYLRPDGTYGTVALVGSGNGGKSFVALDVTSTIDASGTAVGPRPLWSAVPGDGEAGQALAKAAVARVLIGGRDRFVAIAATGVAHDNPAPPYTRGRIVAAYDVATGELLWRFQAQCPVTSDVSVFETDDEGPTATLNGYIDRAVFADACGYVYKVDPARDLDGAWNDNRGLGALAVDPVLQPPLEPVPQHALFSTERTAGALGAASPIAGTIATRTDDSTRVALFFGTGGLENHAVTAANEFYAVYADTGQIRSKLTGACVANRCEKFYGGTVTATDQVIFTRTIDPAVGTPTCETGSTKVSIMGLAAGAGGTFVEDQPSQELGSAVMGAVYGDNDAVYFATLAGDIARVGTPRAGHAGDDSANPPPLTGSGSDNVPTGTIGTSSPMTMLGWRQVY